MGGIFEDAARETDAFGRVMDTGLEILDRVDRIGGQVQLNVEGTASYE
jgi:hypothetical protein